MWQRLDEFKETIIHHHHYHYSDTEVLTEEEKIDKIVETKTVVTMANGETYMVEEAVNQDQDQGFAEMSQQVRANHPCESVLHLTRVVQANVNRTLEAEEGVFTLFSQIDADNSRKSCLPQCLGLQE